MRPYILNTTDASGGAKTSAVAPLDIHGRPEVSLQAQVTGTATYTIEQTLDDVFDASITPVWFSHPDTTLVNATTSLQGNYAYIPRAVRLRQTAGTGSVKLTIIQVGDNRA